MPWTVSPEFSRSVAVGGRIICNGTVMVGGTSYPLKLTDCSVTLQEGNVRRSCSMSAIPDLSNGQRTDDLYDLLSSDLATFRIVAGFQWGPGRSETVAAFTGRATEVGASQGSGKVTISASDFAADLAAIDLIPAVTQASTMTRRDAIKAIIADCFPDAMIVDTSTDTGTLGSDQTWSGKAWDAINTMAADGGIDVSAGPDGNWYMRDEPEIGNPVRLYRMGPAGTVKSIDRRRPLDKMYNRVIVQPSATDGSQGWDSVTYDITSLDPTSPRRSALAGVRVKTITSPTASVDEAVALAVRTMKRAMGRTEKLSTAMFLDPSVDLYDTVQIVGQREADGGVIAVNHLVDGATFDILSGGKAAWSSSLSTRNMGVSDG